MNLNFGQIFQTLERCTDLSKPAAIDFDAKKTCSWGELLEQSDRVAAYLQSCGIERGEKVAFYSRNRIEYLVAMVAIFKIGLVHVNVNFRYKNEELLHVFDDSDASVVFYSSEFSCYLSAIKNKLPKVKQFVEFDQGGATELLDSRAFTSILSGDYDKPRCSDSPDDLFFMYTGGTTGLPKGVIWKQSVLFQVIGINRFAKGGPRFPLDRNDYEEMLHGAGAPALVNAPWMHSTGLYCVLTSLFYGGTVVFNGGEGFSAERTWDAVATHQVQMLNVTGDAMAKPLLDSLKMNPGRWQLDSLRLLLSAAAVFSTHLKREFIRLLPGLTITDGLGSSESSGVGSLSLNKETIDSYDDSKGFTLRVNKTVRVFKEDMTEVAPGSGEVGMVATGGPISEGYYKDSVKTAKTYRTVKGERYCILGDYVAVLHDGSIRFLGRGNVCINTGGEKVYPEEVEGVVKRHPSVDDCAIVGVPDERWGSAVTAVVHLEPGATLDEKSIKDFVREQLSGYKVPKHVVEKPDFKRSPSGKLDYKTLRAFAIDQVVK